jgi:hypothetical protein
MIKLTQEREIAPYVWGHPDEERCARRFTTANVRRGESNMQFSIDILDNLIAPKLSLLSSCGAPEVPELPNYDVVKKCFVICPIGEPNSLERAWSDDVFDSVISPIAMEFNYAARRAIMTINYGVTRWAQPTINPAAR